MLIRRKMIAAAAVLSLAGGLGTLAAVPASAATPQCGASCIEVYSAKYATPTSLGFVETVLLGIPVAGRADRSAPGQQIELRRGPDRPPRRHGEGVPVLRAGHGLSRCQRAFR